MSFWHCYKTIWHRHSSDDNAMKGALASAFKMPQHFLMGLVKGYRLLLSPWLGSACRFEPTCSAYSLCALEQHGALGGAYLTVRRLARCQPWCSGGYDPVPQHTLFTSLVTPSFTPLLTPSVKSSSSPLSKQHPSPEKKSS